MLGRLTALALLALCRITAQNQQSSEEVTPTFGTTVVIPSGLRGQIYLLRPGEFMLPDFRRLEPIGTIYTTSLQIWPQDWAQGFPGVTNRFEWFAIDYTGRFWIEKSGEYRFSLISDDGSKLYIDERLLIDNDGQHPPQTKERRIKLGCGVHDIRVSYFQGPRIHVALVLSVAGPKEKMRIFSTDEFKPPPNPETWTCDAPELLATPKPDRQKLRGADSPGRQTVAKRDDERLLPFEGAALTALRTRPLPQAFDFQFASFHFRSGATGSENAVAFEVTVASLTAKPQSGGGSHRVHVSLLALVKHPDGRRVDKFGLDAPYTIPDAKLASAQASTLSYTHPLKVPPGLYTVEVALIDQEGKRSSARAIEINAPEPPPGIGLSSIVLVERVEPVRARTDVPDPLVFEGNRVVPRLATTLEMDSNPQVYFVVYPNERNPDRPRVQVKLLVAGRVLAEQSADLPPAGPDGTIPMIVAAATRPGDCELRITVVQGAESATEAVKYNVH